MTENEGDRQYRIVDQMMTIHACLRDRYGRRERLLNAAMLACAVALNGFVFVSDDILVILFGGAPERVKIGLGVASIVVLILAVIGSRVGWAGRSRSHAEAVARLGRLKAKYREAYAKRTDEGAAEGERLNEDYARTMSDLPPIPDRQFARLKAYHLFKRQLSREIDRCPGVPATLLVLRLRYGAIRRMLRDPKRRA